MNSRNARDASTTDAVISLDVGEGSRPGSKDTRLFASIAVVVVLGQLIFVSTPFRIDEPNILAIARQMAVNPVDPYGFEINWSGTPQPALDVLANPPLLPAWLALVGSLFGWSEMAMHVAMIPFAIIALLSFSIIARRFGLEPYVAVLLLGSVPAFVLAGQCIMPDLPMLSLLLAATAAAIIYRETGARGALAVAAVASFLTPIAKYNGMTVAAILGWLWITTQEQRRGLAVLTLAPFLGLAAWSFASWLQYGEVHFFVIAAFEQGGGFRREALYVVVTLGLAITPLVFGFAPLYKRRALRRLELLFSVAAVVSLGIGIFTTPAPWQTAVLCLAGAVAGARVLLAVVVFASDRRNGAVGERILPLIWIGASMTFLLRVIFTAPRYMLPITPAVVLACAPSLSKRKRAWFVVAISVQVALALALSFADGEVARSHRRYVDEVVAPLTASGRRVFYAGHWGFQEYATRAGAVLIDLKSPPEYLPGDVLILPLASGRPIAAPRGPSVEFVRRVDSRTSAFPVRTIDLRSRIHFHTSQPPASPWAPLVPFGFSREPVERFVVYEAVPQRNGVPIAAPDVFHDLYGWDIGLWSPR